MTRRIARLQHPGTRLTTSDAQQFDMPVLAREFIERASRRRSGRDPPARGGGIGFCGLFFFAGMTPAPDEKRRYTRLAGTELQAAGGGERKMRRFADDTGKAFASQPFFHRRQHVPVFPGLAVDDAVGVQSDAGESGGEEIASAQAPENGTRQPREDSGGENAGNGSVLTRRTRFDDFVQMTQAQSIAWQMLIDSLDPEGQRCGRADAMPRHPFQAGAKFGNSCRLAGQGHPRVSQKFRCSTFVLFVLGVNGMFKTPEEWGFLALRPDREEALG
jgi:hypothetical protein